MGALHRSEARFGAAGAGVTLAREDWHQLFRAAGHTLP
jgi:hypothetical protein